MSQDNFGKYITSFCFNFQINLFVRPGPTNVNHSYLLPLLLGLVDEPEGGEHVQAGPDNCKEEKGKRNLLISFLLCYLTFYHNC